MAHRRDSPTEPRSIPAHLVPLELERELLAGGFNAVDLLNGEPRHEGARRALEVIRSFDAQDLCYPEHRSVLKAMQDVLSEDGTLSPALVLAELRRRRRWGAARLLPDLVTYALAPVLGLPALAHRVRESAGRRREFAQHRRAAAHLLEEPS